MKHLNIHYISKMKGFIKIFILLSVFSYNYALFAQNTINCVKFQNSQTATMVGDNGIIMKTLNGGDSWENKISSTNKNLRSVEFTMGNTGFAAGDDGTILKTNDGGETWRQVNSIAGENLNDVCVITGSRYAAACGNNGKLLVSVNNSGDIWLEINSGTNNNLKDLFFVNAFVGFAIGDNSTLLKTTNGGRSWNPIEMQFGNRNFNSIFAFDENNLIAAGELGSVFITNDGGINWYNADVPNFELSFNHIIFYNSNTGIIVADQGILLITTDGGLSWQHAVTGIINNPDLYTVSFADNKNGISAGKNGCKLYTLDGGVTWNEKNHNNQASGNKTAFSLSQNYPNPFNPSTQISYNLPFEGIVSLKVYDMLGKEITTLVNGYVNAGKYTVSFNGPNLSSGIYFYVLKSTSGSQSLSKTMRMILTK